jgi:hypothetical protein
MAAKKTVDGNLIPLSREEALEAMKAGEYLVNGVDPWHIKQYRWDGGNIISYDSWEYDCGGGVIVPMVDLPQLYRQGPKGSFRSITDAETYWRNDENRKKAFPEGIEAFQKEQEKEPKAEGKDMADVVFNPTNMDTEFYAGDCRDWAIQDGRCFGIDPGGNIGYVPQKRPGVVDYEGTRMTREEFAEMYPQVGLSLDGIPKAKNNSQDKKTTWEDIENTLKNIQGSPVETDAEKLAYFKGKVLAHLDNLQAEEDKKIIPFPKANPKKEG